LAGISATPFPSKGLVPNPFVGSKMFLSVQNILNVVKFFGRSQFFGSYSNMPIYWSKYIF
jgi:hypothetical protein